MELAVRTTATFAAGPATWVTVALAGVAGVAVLPPPIAASVTLTVSTSAFFPLVRVTV